VAAAVVATAEVTALAAAAVEGGYGDCCMTLPLPLSATAPISDTTTAPSIAGLAANLKTGIDHRGDHQVRIHGGRLTDTVIAVVSVATDLTQALKREPSARRRASWLRAWC
jgi:hypothetical protein